MWASSHWSPGVSPVATATASASSIRAATWVRQVSSDRCSRAAPSDASVCPGFPTATTGPYDVSSHATASSNGSRPRNEKSSKNGRRAEAMVATRSWSSPKERR